MSVIAPSQPTRLTHPGLRHHVRLATALAAAALVTAGVPAGAAELRPTAGLPEARQHLLSDATARAVDHVRVARREIAERRSYEARKELAQASTLLAQARSAAAATRVAQELAALQIRLQDPTLEIPAEAFDFVLTAIDEADDREAFSATRRHVERGRYFRRDGVAASAELVAAMARIPQGEIDGPLAGAAAHVQVATIELYAGNLEAADRVLARAERSALAAVRIAGGGEADWLDDFVDVAAPPPVEAGPLEDAPDPATTESQIPAPAEFQESNDGEPAASQPAAPPDA